DPQVELGSEYYANLYHDPVVWARHQKTFDELITATRKRIPPIPLMVMIFPVMHVIGPDYPYKDVHQQLVSFFESRSVPVVDLEPIYSPVGREKLLVSERDFHANELGHKLAGEAVFEKIKEEGWFPSSCPQLSLMR
ncbi:MAG: hypothetical protein Q8R11_00665, partial [bacterium]|nr:hypothetical protein [bacterium]